MYKLNLNGKWEMKCCDLESEWMEVTVPGSVYYDLLTANKIEDPFWRDNEEKSLEICCHDYEYTRVFTISEDVIKSDMIYLQCLGLDTLCEIYINEKILAYTNNMHRTYELNIKDFIHVGENKIKIIMRSPVNYVLQKDKEDHLISSSCAVPGISHIRKASCMFGWDWGPKLPDMGIWRDIAIIYGNRGRISDMYIRQVHTEGKVTLNFELDYSLIGKATTVCNRIIVTDGNGNEFVAETKNDRATIIIEKPDLWWPNGYGKQPLYHVVNELYVDGVKTDSKEMKIGLRTLTINKEKDEYGSKFEFMINGISIFAMGADYIIEDNILPRCNREKTENLIKDCVKSNFNVIRVWGGALYPEDYFFDLCDEYGLIVWQDFMFANAMYNFDDEFKENISAEIIDNIKRLRHHASLGVWCGNNEIEELWDGRWRRNGSGTPSLKGNYIKMFEVLIPEFVAKHDPDRFFWSSSPSSKGSFDDPNGEEHGDMHYWGVWHAMEPFTAFRKLYPRMMTEFGLQSFPDYKTIKSFTLPEDRNIFSYVMEAHQKSQTGNEKIMNYIGMTYKYPKNFESLVYVSQLIQAEGIKYGVEHWRRNRGRCMGAIYWQLNDCWPVASWSSIDSCGRWKALQYIAKRFYAPVMVSGCEEGSEVSLWISNETMQMQQGKFVWRLMDNKSSVLLSGEREIEINPLSSYQVETLDFSNQLVTAEQRRSTVLEYYFENNQEKISEGCVCFEKYKHFSFVNPYLETSVFEEHGNIKISISSNTFAKFVRLDLENTDVVFSDNYFDITGGNKKTISVEKMSTNISLEEFEKQLRVTSLFDTYE